MNNEMANTCKWHQQLVTYLYGEASQEEARQFENHLQSCADCRNEFEEFSLLRGVLQKWQITDAPRVVIEPKRSAFDALRELFQALPVWAKLATAAAAGLLVLAIINTDVSIGNGGISFRASIIPRAEQPSPSQIARQIDREAVLALISEAIAASEKRQQRELAAKLTELADEIRARQDVDLSKFAAELRREQRLQLAEIRRDLDEQSDTLSLSEILFKEGDSR